MFSSSRKQMYGNNLGQFPLPAPEVKLVVELTPPPKSKFVEALEQGKIKVVPNQLWPETEGIRSLNPWAC